jgi:hypothetical protein
MGIIVPMEGGRSIVTLGGRGEDWPPGDWHGFLDYAQQLTTPTIYHAIRRTQPLGEIVHKLLLEVHHLLKPRSLLGDPDLVRRVTMEQIAA